MELANQLLRVAAAVEAAAAASGSGTGASGRAAGSVTAGTGGVASAGAAGQQQLSDEQRYAAELAPFHVRLVDGVKANHCFAQKAGDEAMQPKARVRRVGRELASLEADLPINRSSSGRWGGGEGWGVPTLQLCCCALRTAVCACAIQPSRGNRATPAMLPCAHLLPFPSPPPPPPPPSPCCCSVCGGRRILQPPVEDADHGARGHTLRRWLLPLRHLLPPRLPQRLAAGTHPHHRRR